MSNDEKTAADNEPIVAVASRDYRIRRYIMTVLMLGFGAYFLYDGYIGYPKENRAASDARRRIESATQRAQAAATEEERQAAEAEAEAARVELKAYSEHSPTDIRLQKILGYTLIPLSLVFLVYILHKSRSAYRLENGVLHVPGHPPVPLESITEMDKGLWDRKGIAFINYQLTGGEAGQIKLDDFIYQQKPTDAIVERIEQHLRPPEDDAKQAVSTPAPAEGSEL